ncbi:bile acid:sodium symporter family protein [Paludibacter sp. 221]|uniref:bile acid:sodium symporter family protein n=1 Tax=Paludibacter sp. 221 TaxID=2302939 RepID=UPI0013D8B91C|nr:bile acid:sodium symporter family protein [Paludibacter sp. 221]NDV45557.1 bile acid:sodium symporter family protein [Paludibacter sp. 221]
MYESLLQLDSIRINFSQSYILNFVLAFIMFGVALGIRASQFKKLVLSPKPVVLGLALQFVALPLITFLLVLAFSKVITPTVAMGMILVAACPGGNISNFMTSLSKGNTELSVTLTAISTGLAIFMTPFNFSFWGGLYVRFISNRAELLQPLEIEFGQMFETVFIILGIPVVLGILCTRYLPRIAARLKKPLQYLSIIFFIALVAIMFANNWKLFTNYIHYIFIIVLVHNLVALTTGYSVATLFKQPDRNRRTMTIETGIQNSGLGLVLLFNPKIFSPDLAIGGMLFVTAWWGIWHIVSGLTISTYWSRKPPKEAE